MGKKEEKKEAPESAVEPAREEKPPKKPKTWLYLLLGLIFGGAGGGAGLYLGGFLGPPPGSQQAAINDTAQQMLDEAVQSAVDKILSESSAGGANGSSLPVTQVLELDPFIVGLEGAGTVTYARVGIGFGFNSEDAETPVVDPVILLPKIKDYLLSHMSSKSLAELAGGPQREKIKNEVKDAVAAMIPSDRGSLVEVYLTEFLIQ